MHLVATHRTPQGQLQVVKAGDSTLFSPFVLLLDGYQGAGQPLLAGSQLHDSDLAGLDDETAGWLLAVLTAAGLTVCDEADQRLDDIPGEYAEIARDVVASLRGPIAHLILTGTLSPQANITLALLTVTDLQLDDVARDHRERSSQRQALQSVPAGPTGPLMHEDVDLGVGDAADLAVRATLTPIHDNGGLPDFDRAFDTSLLEYAEGNDEQLLNAAYRLLLAAVLSHDRLSGAWPVTMHTRKLWQEWATRGGFDEIDEDLVGRLLADTAAKAGIFDEPADDLHLRPSAFDRGPARLTALHAAIAAAHVMQWTANSCKVGWPEVFDAVCTTWF